MKYFGVLYIVILGLYFAQSATLYGWHDLISPKIYKNSDLLTFVRYHDDGALSSEVDAFQSPKLFRENEFRTGEVVTQLPSNLEPIVVIENFNVGIHSAAKSTVISNDDLAYVGTDSGWFYAIDKRTFETVWSLYVANSNRGIHSSAVLEGNHLWIGDYSGRMMMLNAHTGKIIWHRFLGQTIGASPLLVDESLYVNVETTPPNGALFKLNKLTGEVIWRSESYGEQSHSSLTTNEDHTKLFLGANNGQFFCLSAHDGTTLWKQQLVGGPLRSAPSYFDGRVYLLAMNGRFHILDAQTGQSIKEIAISDDARSSPSIDRELRKIYFSDQAFLYRTDLKGDHLVKIDVGNHSNISSPVVVKSLNNKMIYQVCYDRDLCAIDRELKKIHVIFKGNYRITATPHFTGGQIWLPAFDGPLIVLKEARK